MFTTEEFEIRFCSVCFPSLCRNDGRGQGLPDSRAGQWRGLGNLGMKCWQLYHQPIVCCRGARITPRSRGSFQFFRSNIQWGARAVFHNLGCISEASGELLENSIKPWAPPQTSWIPVFGGGGWARAFLKSSPDDSNGQPGLRATGPHDLWGLFLLRIQQEWILCLS
jgi:hypothetical protein